MLKVLSNSIVPDDVAHKMMLKAEHHLLQGHFLSIYKPSRRPRYTESKEI